MKIELWGIGNTTEKWLKEGEGIYLKRLKHYVQTETRYLTIPSKEITAEADIMKKREAELFLKHLKSDDFIILLDERGTAYSSELFSSQLEKWMNRSPKRMVFLSGGAFGIDESIRQKSIASLSLSSMTFTHQMVRLFFLEQLYRAFTILRNESYHNS